MGVLGETGVLGEIGGLGEMGVQCLHMDEFGWEWERFSLLLLLRLLLRLLLPSSVFSGGENSQGLLVSW